MRVSAIIVGGGPVGLFAANALHKANIRFTLLEQRRSAVLDEGSDLFIAPVGLLAAERLGLREKLNEVSTALGKITRFDHNNKDLGELTFVERIKDTCGMSPRIISRRDLTKVLYDALPISARDSVIPSKKVKSMSDGGDKVTVHCEDSSSYTATIVIAADGAHSTIRGLMRDAALSAGSKAVNPAHPFLTTFSCLWIRFPIPKGMKPGCMSETHDENAATQLFADRETAVMGLYERLPAPGRE